MMTAQEKLIARFLRQEQSNKPIARYMLRKADKGRKPREVETFEIVEALQPTELDQFAGTILSRAQDDADGLGPVQQHYKLESYVKVGDGSEDIEPNYSSCVHFRVKGAPDPDLDDEDGEEAPSNRGLMQQLMRHNEANARTLVGAMGQMMHMMTSRAASQEETIERLLHERTEMLKVVEDARTEQMERQLVLESEQAKQKRIDFGMQKAAMLAPVVLSHLTGGKVGSKESPNDLIMKELIGSVTPEQLQGLAKLLRPEQQIAFFRLYETLAKETNEPKKLDEGETNGSEVH